VSPSPSLFRSARRFAVLGEGDGDGDRRGRRRRREWRRKETATPPATTARLSVPTNLRDSLTTTVELYS
jgi:hypothetical protein